MANNASNTPREFLAMTDRQLAKDLLATDPLYGKIPTDQIDFYITRAFEISEEIAEPYIGADAAKLCEDFGVSIHYSDKETYFNTKIRSEIIIGNNTRAITIYKGAAEELSKNSRVLPEEYHLSEDKALQLMLVHELFHLMEDMTGKRINEMLPRIVCWRLPLGIKNTATIIALSEVGAHRFCQIVLGLERYPYLYDKMFAHCANTNN